MKKVVMIIALNDFRDEEIFQPKAILEKAGVEVKVASTSLKVAKGMLGGTVKADMLVSDIKTSDFDAIVFIGGSGARQYWNDAVAHKLVRDAFNTNKIVSAICIAPITLAKAGILKGRRATVWSTEAGQLKVAGGAIYTGKDVEKDGNIITAAGPFAAGEFGNEIVKALLY
jgi:protease I